MRAPIKTKVLIRKYSVFLIVLYGIISLSYISLALPGHFSIETYQKSKSVPFLHKQHNELQSWAALMQVEQFVYPQTLTEIFHNSSIQQLSDGNSGHSTLNEPSVILNNSLATNFGLYRDSILSSPKHADDILSDKPKRLQDNRIRLGIHASVIQHQLKETDRHLNPIPVGMAFPTLYSVSSGAFIDIPLLPFRMVFSPHYTAYTGLSDLTISKPNGLPVDYNLHINYRVIHVPLTLRFPLYVKDFDFFAGAGLNYTRYAQTDAALRVSNIIPGYGIMFVMNDTFSYTERKANKLGYLLEGGMSYRISEQYQVQLAVHRVYYNTMIETKFSYPIFHSKQLMLRLTFGYIL